MTESEKALFESVAANRPLLSEWEQSLVSSIRRDMAKYGVGFKLSDGRFRKLMEINEQIPKRAAKKGAKR